eukprot:238671_1
MTTNFVQTGIKTLKEAIQKDNEQDCENALSLYSQGIQYLMTGLKYEKNQKVQAAIKEKIHKYLNRAEELKSNLSPKTTKNKPKKKKKKKLHKYPTQQEITAATNNADEDT